jgi:hypothetical protein
MLHPEHRTPIDAARSYDRAASLASLADVGF